MNTKKVLTGKKKELRINRILIGLKRIEKEIVEMTDTYKTRDEWISELIALGFKQNEKAFLRDLAKDKSTLWKSVCFQRYQVEFK